LNESGWAVVHKEGITKAMVKEAMEKVVNVKAFELHMNSPQRVRNAELEEIWDGVVM